jgi:hypothetical protein
MVPSYDKINMHARLPFSLLYLVGNRPKTVVVAVVSIVLSVLI